MSEAQLNSEGEKLKEKVSSGISAQVVVGLLLQKKITQEKKERKKEVFETLLKAEI